MFICLFVLLLISIPADHKASFSFFVLACVCPRIVSLPVSLPAIISFCFSTEMLTFFYASKSVCLFVRLFVWHLPVFFSYFYFYKFWICNILIIFISNHLSFLIWFYSSVYWSRIQNIESKQNGLHLPVSCMGKPIKLSIYLFVLFVL